MILSTFALFRFNFLNTPAQVGPQKLEKIISASIIIHNMLRSLQPHDYQQARTPDDEVWDLPHPVVQFDPVVGPAFARIARDKLAEYYENHSTRWMWRRALNRRRQ